MSEKKQISTNFSTSNQTFRQLFGNGLQYVVPRFQRDYSWEKDHWEDLWQDIQNLLTPEGDSSHYMGYLVLKTEDNRVFEVIDGQQRLTTISLIALGTVKALIDLANEGIDADNNRQRSEQLRNTYIGYLDPVTLIAKPKLTLNRNNDAFYKDRILPLGSIPSRNLRSSERLLGKAFEWFCDQIWQKYGNGKSGPEIASFLDNLSDRLFFTVITVPNDLNAYLVFETLNSRGVRLSPTDLLKNYLFSVVDKDSNHPDEIDTLERRWEKMVSQLGGESFPDFLRTHWNSRQNFARESELFKTIRNNTQGKQAVFQLLRNMEEDLDVFVGLRDPNSDIWNTEQRELVRQLKMFSVRQPWPLLLAAYRAFPGEGFTAILKSCSVISFRYNVIGALAGNEQERRYNEVARKISEAKYARAEHAIRDLKSIYISDTAFRSAFEERRLQTSLPRNKNIVRYILFEMERKTSGQQLDSESAEYTIEHILPENSGSNWPEFNTSQCDNYLYRLGNMTLLERQANTDLGSKSANEKLRGFAQSIFETTKSIERKNDDWTPERIAARQQEMAGMAVEIWRIPRLHE